MAGPARRRWARVALALGFTTLFVAGGVWIMRAYVELVRLQVHEADAWARVEAMSRARIELVRNVVHALGAGPAPVERAARDVSRAAVELLDQTSGAPTLDGAHLERYRQEQERLSAAISALWGVVARSASPPAQRLIADLRPKVERRGSELTRALDVLVQTHAQYDAATRGLPGAWIARAAGLREPSETEAARPARLGG